MHHIYIIIHWPICPGVEKWGNESNLKGEMEKKWAKMKIGISAKKKMCNLWVQKSSVPILSQNFKLGGIESMTKKKILIYGL